MEKLEHTEFSSFKGLETVKNKREDDAEEKRVTDKDSPVEGRREYYPLALVKSLVLAGGWTFSLCQGKKDKGSSVNPYFGFSEGKMTPDNFFY